MAYPTEDPIWKGKRGPGPGDQVGGSREQENGANAKGDSRCFVILKASQEKFNFQITLGIGATQWVPSIIFLNAGENQ